jgi:hypothetical protein
VTFLHPAILGVGLACVAIPIIIHFLRRRRRPIPWAAMRFLQEAMRKRRRRLRLEQLLLLLSRCALVALLALAVARPTLGAGAGAGRPTTLVLAIDNSIASAQREASGRTGLQRSINAARAALQNVDPARGDAVGLVTLGAPGEALVWPPSPDPDAVRRALDRLEPTDSRVTLGALRRALGERAEDEDGRRTEVRLLSAWRGVDAPTLFEGAPLARVDAIDLSPPGEAGGANAGLADLAVSTPTVVGAASLAPGTRVSGVVVRSGDLPAQELAVELIAQPGGVIAGRGVARFEQGQERASWSVSVDDAALTPGRAGRVAVVARLPDDANPRDNTARVVLSKRRELRVGVVERAPVAGDLTPGAWVLAALTPDERAGIESFRIDPASLGSVPAGSVDALFVLEPSRVPDAGWTRVRELLSLGGLVVLTPGVSPELAWGGRLSELSGGELSLNANAGVREEPTRLSPDEPGALLGALRGEFADLASSVGVSRRVLIDSREPDGVVLRTQDGGAVLAQSGGADGRGVLAVFASAFDVDWTDLPARPLFVPVLQEIVRRGSGRGVDAGVVAGAVGTADDAGVDRWEPEPSLAGEDAGGSRPGSRSGVFVALGADGRVLRTVAVNPDADAARAEPARGAELGAGAAALFPGSEIRSDGDAGDAVASARQRTAWGDGLALTLLAIAAALAVLEAVLARAASHPAHDAPGRAAA